jgi:hypothetical protein
MYINTNSAILARTAAKMLPCHLYATHSSTSRMRSCQRWVYAVRHSQQCSGHWHSWMKILRWTLSCQRPHCARQSSTSTRMQVGLGRSCFH